MTSRPRAQVAAEITAAIVEQVAAWEGRSPATSEYAQALPLAHRILDIVAKECALCGRYPRIPEPRGGPGHSHSIPDPRRAEKFAARIRATSKETTP